MSSGNSPPAAERALVVSWLRRFEDGIMVVMLSAMILLSTFQILLRNFWQSGLTWGDPLLRVMVLWIGLLGAMAATRDGKHINVDILSRLLPQRGRAFAKLGTDAFSAGVCGLFAYHAGRFVWSEYQAGDMAFDAVPAWLCEVIVPLGFGVIALRFLASLVATLRGISDADA